MSDHIEMPRMICCVQDGCTFEHRYTSTLLRHLWTNRFFFCDQCCEEFDSHHSLETHQAPHDPCPPYCIAFHGESDTHPLTEHAVLGQRHRQRPGCRTWRNTDVTERWRYLYYMYHFGRAEPAPSMNGPQLDIPYIAQALPLDAQPYEMLSVLGFDPHHEFPAAQAVPTTSGHVEPMIVELPLSELSQFEVHDPGRAAVHHHGDVMFGANIPTVEPSWAASQYSAPSHFAPNGYTVLQEPQPEIALQQTQEIDPCTQGWTTDMDAILHLISLETYNIDTRPL